MEVVRQGTTKRDGVMGRNGERGGKSGAVMERWAGGRERNNSRRLDRSQENGIKKPGECQCASVCEERDRGVERIRAGGCGAKGKKECHSH